jgi:hypothetical protein
MYLKYKNKNKPIPKVVDGKNNKNLFRNGEQKDTMNQSNKKLDL